MKKITTLLFVSLALTTAACKTTQTTHGQIISQRQLAALKPNVHQKADVQAILGSPSTTSTLNGNRWFYITANSTLTPVIGTEITDQNVLILHFNENNTLTSLNKKSASTDGQDITPAQGATPTQGEKLGIMEQLLDNLGLGL